MLIYFSCYYVTEYFTNLMILYMDFFSASLDARRNGLYRLVAHRLQRYVP